MFTGRPPAPPPTPCVFVFVYSCLCAGVWASLDMLAGGRWAPNVSQKIGPELSGLPTLRESPDTGLGSPPGSTDSSTVYF